MGIPPLISIKYESGSDASIDICYKVWSNKELMNAVKEDAQTRS